MSEMRDRVYAAAGFGGSAGRGQKPAVLVVDFTYGFTDPQYPTGADMSDAVAATRKLVDLARSAGHPVIFTTISYTDAEIPALPWLKKATGMAALKAGTRLVDLDDRLGRRDDEALIVKHGASAFHGTNLCALLSSRQVDTLIVTGATTSGCVRASVVDAVQNGFNVLVPRDCVADRASGPHDANIFDIQQKYADVVSLEEALILLSREA
ncbi:Maleamate amidohydrolase [Hyphomicrobiales bacterium]|nr:Maleamate amidohydrolase [Hyphomicrobiales bacterium]CAH1676962.1 Maleamate amidohydrolase [Hyphomicrobiales bacterium]